MKIKGTADKRVIKRTGRDRKEQVQYRKEQAEIE